MINIKSLLIPNKGKKGSFTIKIKGVASTAPRVGVSELYGQLTIPEPRSLGRVEIKSAGRVEIKSAGRVEVKSEGVVMGTTASTTMIHE